MNNPSVALAILTWNRSDVFIETMEKSLKNTGMELDEIVWVDNGSDYQEYAEMKKFMAQFKNVTKIRHHKNFGMVRGFNTCFANTRSDLIIISGPDVVYDDDWVKTYYEYITSIEDAGTVALYNVPFEKVMERAIGENKLEVLGSRELEVYRGLPLDHYIFKRSILKEVGYWHEGFGLYAWADVAWAFSVAEHLPKKTGLNCYVIPPEKHTGKHHGKAGARQFKDETGQPMDYNKFRDREITRPENTKLLTKCREANWPYYFPF